MPKNVFDDIAAAADKYGQLWEAAKASGSHAQADAYSAITLDLSNIIIKWGKK